jgi:hypothetical protein
MRRVLLLAFLVLPACQRGAPSDSPIATTPPTAFAPTVATTVDLRVHDASGQAGPFRMDDLDLLSVELDVTAPAGLHEARVDVVTPGGTLYAQLPATVEVSRGSAASSSATVRVRGTSIETYRQVGTWQFRAFVDGAAMASSDVEVTE